MLGHYSLAYIRGQCCCNLLSYVVVDDVIIAVTVEASCRIFCQKKRDVHMDEVADVVV